MEKKSTALSRIVAFLLLSLCSLIALFFSLGYLTSIGNTGRFYDSYILIEGLMCLIAAVLYGVAAGLVFFGIWEL